MGQRLKGIYRGERIELDEIPPGIKESAKVRLTVEIVGATAPLISDARQRDLYAKP